MVDQEVTIVLAEDDEGHALLAKKNLKRSGLINHLQWCRDGRQALDYILGEGEFSGSPHMKIVLLLDLNMPVMDGYQVLEHLKSGGDTKRIPVIILTTTSDEHEIKRCYDLGCNIYITKPVDYEAFSRAIVELGLFLSVVSISNGQ